MLKPKNAVVNLPIYAAPPEGRMGSLRLDFNENTQGASPKVLAALRAVTAAECGCYPEYDELKKALARYLGLDTAMVLPTNGSDEAIKIVFETFVSKNDKVILLTPTFSMYEVYATLAEANQVVIPFAECDDFAYPVEAILNAIDGETKLVVLATPNNPTGSTIAREDLIRIIEKNPNTAILIDEAYAAFANSSSTDLAAKYSNVLVTQTFSKDFGLAGLRIAYLVSQAANVHWLKRVINPYSVNRFAVVAAMAALEDQAFLKQHVEEAIMARNFFASKMAELGYKTYPSQANFLLVNFGKDAEAILDRLRKSNILVRNKSGLVRISFGSIQEAQQVLEAISAPKTALIFDMDGVLVDDSLSYLECIKKTVEQLLGQSIDNAVVKAAKAGGGCNDDYDCVAKILAENGKVVPPETIAELFDAYYETFKFQETWLIDEAILANLRTKYSLGICTGRPKRDAVDALQRFSKTHVFDIVITRDDVDKGKPDPEGLNKIRSTLNATKAIFIGDNPDDALAAERAGYAFIKATPSTPTAWLLGEINRLMNPTKREAYIERRTKETDIIANLNIDGMGQACIQTGIGFFDHMLDAFTKHGGFDLKITCQGDLHIDQHHTVEDVGIVLGEAFAKALGDKRGIARSGYFVFPMDESLAICALDLSNRPHLTCNIEVGALRIGDFDTLNLSNFFSGFVKGAQVNLHVQVPYGMDPHHKVEALFKAFGKALSMACTLDATRTGVIPSTKGLL